MNLPEADLPEWGVFAQFGHNEHAGQIDKVSICGKAMVRVRKYRPKEGDGPDEPFDTVYLGPESMYGCQKLEEDKCREVYRIYKLPAVPSLPEKIHRASEDGEGDADNDDDEFEDPQLEDTENAHELLDKIGTNDSDDTIVDGDIDVRIHELIQRYGFAREVNSFIETAIERFRITANVGMPETIEEDRSNAIRILGEGHRQSERLERMFAMLRELLVVANRLRTYGLLQINSPKTGQ